MNQRELFLKHVAQTSAAPLALEITKARGSTLFGTDGKSYIDLIGGISVANVGHCHPKVVSAIQQQAEKYLHLLVYGEMIQSPQVYYASQLAANLPSSLNAVYFTNSGAEAVEGAMKLAKKATGRTEMVCFKESYHGSTQGALSLMGSEYWRNAFRPLLPGILHAAYNNYQSLDLITKDTACVIAESVQAERGVFAPDIEWMRALRNRCHETGAVLVLDEIQTGFGRTGTLWYFEQLGIVPDILLLGKALGAGMPLGAFICDRKLMWELAENPALGHITTFGGHPVSCAAGLAGLELLLKEDWIGLVGKKEALFKSLLRSPKIKAIRSQGLLMALEFDDFETNKKIIDACLNSKDKAVLTDWFLFAPHCMRIAPPLLITEEEIEYACGVIMRAIG
jgi:acetylornithine/N-succinyldiaminopimelate aminotransferase